MSIGELWRKAKKTSRLLARSEWRRGLLHGVAATVEHSPLMTMIHPRTVIDVGANKGQFTLFALEAWLGCQVIAYEQLPGRTASFAPSEEPSEVPRYAETEAERRTQRWLAPMFDTIVPR